MAALREGDGAAHRKWPARSSPPRTSLPGDVVDPTVADPPDWLHPGGFVHNRSRSPPAGLPLVHTRRRSAVSRGVQMIESVAPLRRPHSALMRSWRTFKQAFHRAFALLRLGGRRHAQDPATATSTPHRPHQRSGGPPSPARWSVVQTTVQAPCGPTQPTSPSTRSSRIVLGTQQTDVVSIEAAVSHLGNSAPWDSVFTPSTALRASWWTVSSGLGIRLDQLLCLAGIRMAAARRP